MSSPPPGFSRDNPPARSDRSRAALAYWDERNFCSSEETSPASPGPSPPPSTPPRSVNRHLLWTNPEDLRSLRAQQQQRQLLNVTMSPMTMREGAARLGTVGNGCHLSGPSSQSFNDPLPTVPAPNLSPTNPHPFPTNPALTKHHQPPMVRRDNTALGKPAASRLAKNTICMAGGESRLCIPESICALLQVGSRRTAWEAMLSARRTDRDMCLKDLIPTIAPLGIWVRRVTGQYNRWGGVPLHLFTMTKNKNCILLIDLNLVDLKGRRCRHFVAFDGKNIYDHPMTAKVNQS